MTFFESTDDFLKIFNLENHTEYFEPITLNDRKVGFSIKRKYPENIRYKPAFKRDGEPDDIALMWVKYTHPDETDKIITTNKVPLVIRISLFSRYRAKHFDYNYEDNDSPTEESVKESESSPKPISLNFDNEFFFNHDTNQFFDETDHILTPVEILDRVFEDHCNTTHPWKGFKVQAKIFTQAKGVGLIDILILIITYLLKVLFGRTLDEKDMISEYYHGYKSGQLKKLDQDSINIFSYKASKTVIILFCALIVIATIISYYCHYSIGYFKHISTNNTLSIIHSFIILWILDTVIPTFLFKLINLSIKLRTYVSHMTFKHK